MLALGAALIAGLVWYAAGGATPAPTTTHTTPDVIGAQPPVTSGVVPPSSVAPVEARTVVSLRSTPSGATVNVGESEYGPTPTDVEWTGDDAAPGREVTFVFHLAGHRDYSVVRTIHGDTLDVSATLDALPTDRPFRPRPPRRPEGDDSTSPVGPVKGYKLDPY
jgi:serine/threonine-protein kinase